MNREMFEQKRFFLLPGAIYPLVILRGFAGGASMFLQIAHIVIKTGH